MYVEGGRERTKRERASERTNQGLDQLWIRKEMGFGDKRVSHLLRSCLPFSSLHSERYNLELAV